MIVWDGNPLPTTLIAAEHHNDDERNECEFVLYLLAPVSWSESRGSNWYFCWTDLFRFYSHGETHASVKNISIPYKHNDGVKK